MSSKAFLVALREYRENLRTKTFWIGILFLPVLLSLSIIVPSLLEGTRDARRYAVVDNSGWLGEAVERRAFESDLRDALGAALERVGGEERAGRTLPVPLAEAARAIHKEADGSNDREEARDSLVRRMAAAAAGIAASADSPESEPFPLPKQARELRTWWSEATSEDLARLGVQVSRNRYHKVELGGDALEELNQRVADGDLFAYIVISSDPVLDASGSRYVSSNLTDDDLKDWFQSLASDEIRMRRLQLKEIDPQVAQWVQAPLRLDARKVSGAGGEQEVSDVDFIHQWAPVAFVYLLWMAVFTISQGLLTSTIEEKSNRIIEVLLSSISPLQLMSGKIVGIAATGLTVVGSWVIFFVVLVRYLPALMGADPGFDLTPVVADPIYLLSFLSYFLLGYLFYSALLVAIGSACNSLMEAQNLMMPVIILLIIPLMAMVPISKDPNGSLAKVMSYIPPFTPFVMMNRAAGPPSAFEYLATTVLLLISVAIAFWMAAKVFRIGILMTGKAPKLKEIIRWVRAPVGQTPVRRAGQSEA